MKSGYIISGVATLIILGILLRYSDNFKTLVTGLSQSFAFIISSVEGPATG